MRKALIFSAVLVVAAIGTYFFSRSGTTSAGSAAAGSASPGARAGGMGGPGGGAGAMGRPPMTVDVAAASRATITEELMVVGNLIGLATVDVVPKVSGRLQAINVRLGDSVRKGQVLALLDDREIREQVRQAEASYEVGRATIRQREADLRFAETNLERSRSLFARQLLPQQTLDDADARQQAAAAQLDLSRAQFDQAKARLDELRLTLENTRVVSPVDGFVARRQLDVGAFASSNAPVVSVVDIEVVRLVANLVEKDLRRVQMGTPTRVDVDAYPGETFDGRVARVAPVLDPATRTAQMEVEIPNPQHRLKPGMYARVALLVSRHDNALVVPRNAVVDIEGQRGVFLIDGTTAKFHTVSVGIQDQEKAEILSGLTDGQKVVTTGSNALRDGDPIVQAGQKSGSDARPGRPAPAAPQGR